MNIIITIIITTNLYRNVQVFVLNKSMLFYVIDGDRFVILTRSRSPICRSYTTFPNVEYAMQNTFHIIKCLLLEDIVHRSEKIKFWDFILY